MTTNECRVASGESASCQELENGGSGENVCCLGGGVWVGANMECHN